MGVDHDCLLCAFLLLQNIDLSNVGAPWGSGLSSDIDKTVRVCRLVNTCTIDNLLTIFNFLCLEYPGVKLFWRECPLPVCSVMSAIHEDACSGDWHSAKLRWLSFLGYDTSVENFNIVGDEAEMSFQKMPGLMSSSLTSRCLEGSCSSRSVHHSPAPFLV